MRFDPDKVQKIEIAIKCFEIYTLGGGAVRERIVGMCVSGIGSENTNPACF
ncbi:hypothetical protein [Paludibacter jiangxiensis]|uniref:Uncharacterized protein n=1 Tax=Paludibacter jiangxiensis TaxID=681398 RepID=A0A161L9B4_9BACT|nr:hypothetical protein [Paludibacter jiangxiensis]GAT64034.1 hypothetical protein PJIAN_4577 [Paludibacter jiangxiensis]